MNISSQFASLLLIASLALAQIDTGTIVGTVRDASGATLARASLTLTNLATGVVKNTTANESGDYLLAAVTPGTYSLKVSAPGFKSQLRSRIEINVQSRPSIDFALPVGDVAESVEVTAATPILQTQTADLGGVVQERQIRDLPLNGRRYADLALLEPGVQKNYTNQNNTAADRFSSNGNLETQNYFSLDGVDNNSGSTNLQEGSVQVVQPPPDALQEFRVQTRTFYAEFGTAAGAIINATMKSGTNAFHGSAWEFLRNNQLDANTFFNNATGVPRGKYVQNQFGGTIGGPIVKNKSFFFFDAQNFTSRKASTIRSTVPTPLMKQGNFTELRPTLANPVVAGQSGCITGNIIAASCIDPVGSKILALYPDPNIPSAVALLGRPQSWNGAQNYQFQYSVPNDVYSWDTRIDHNFSPNHRIFGRYSSYDTDRQDPPWTSNPVVGNGNFATQYKIRGKSFALAYTQVLSASALNEIRGGFSKTDANSNPNGLELGKSVASEYGLTGLPTGPNTSGLPPINITGLTRIGTSPWRPQYQLTRTWQLLDTLTWLRGNHSLKFGYEYRRPGNNFVDAQSLQGQMSASGIYSGNSGLGAADFLLGNMSAALYTTPTLVQNYQLASSFFAQDSWRLRRNFTLNYGLRYEIFTPLLNKNNALSNFTPANGGGLITAKSGDLFSRSLIHPDRNNFAPRVGFSYQPFNRLVLRGGFGVFYQHAVRIGGESVLGMNPPAVIDGNITQTLGSTTPVFQLKSGFPLGLFTPAIVDLTRLQVRAQDPNQRTSYVNQVSFGPQYQINESTVLDVSYVGNFGRKLNRLRNANQGRVTGFNAAGQPLTVFPYANLNTNLNSVTGNHAFLQLATNDGNTNYNGLLVSLRKRSSKGINYGGSYTWSHNFADYVDNLTGGSTPADAYNYSLERSNSPFDITHRFVGYTTWDIPIGQGGKILTGNTLASRLIGGWQFNAIVSLQTGTPFTVTAPDVSQTGGSHASRASCISDPYSGASSDRSRFVNSTAPGFFLNPAAFASPATGFFGNCAPRAFHGPGIQNFDLSLFKSFRFTESIRLEFRSEFFNAFNRANFQNPGSNIAPAQIASFGKSLSTITDPRDIQFALKLYF